MIHDPPILLLDEPFTGLDAEASEWLLRLALELRARGRTLCFVLHDLEKTRRLADRVFQLRGGRLTEHDHLADGAPATIAFARARAA